jgi:hypothetical protein
MLEESPVYPKYDYTFKVLNLMYERAGMNVRFTPVNTQLTAFELVLPIRPEMDVNNLKPYLDNFAPNNQWYAQEIILAHSTTLMGNN